MALKLCILLMLAASQLSTAQHLRHALHQNHPTIGHPNVHVNPEYRYSYGVDDTLTGDTKAQTEERNGDFVRGSYSLKESDGSHRIVQYEVGPHTGFNAIITRQGIQNERLRQIGVSSRRQDTMQYAATRQSDYDTEVVDSIEQFPAGQPQPQPEYPQTSYPQPVTQPEDVPAYPQQPQPTSPQPVYPQQPQPEYPQMPQPVYPQQPQPAYPQQPQPIAPQPVYPQQPQLGGIYPAGTQPLSPSSRFSHQLAPSAAHQNLVSHSYDATSGLLSRSAHLVNSVQDSSSIVNRALIHNQNDHGLSTNVRNIHGNHVEEVRQSTSTNQGYTNGYAFTIVGQDSSAAPHGRSYNVNYDSNSRLTHGYNRDNSNRFQGVSRSSSMAYDSRPVYAYQNSQHDQSLSRNAENFQSLAASFGHQASRLASAPISSRNNQDSRNEHPTSRTSIATPFSAQRMSNQLHHLEHSQSGGNAILRAASVEHENHSVVLVTPAPFAYTPLVHPFDLIA